MPPTSAVRCYPFPKKVPPQSWDLMDWRCPAHLRPRNGEVMTVLLQSGVTISISKSQSLLPDPSFLQPQRPAGGKKSLNSHIMHDLRYASCLSAEDEFMLWKRHHKCISVILALAFFKCR